MKNVEIYSISLKAEGEGQNKLQRVVNVISEEFEGPQFTPHVTVVPDVEGSLEEVMDKVNRGLSGICEPLHLKFSGPIIGDEYYKCVYMLSGITPELEELFRSVRGVFGVKLGLHPHLSLIYGNFKKEKKELIAQRSKELLIQDKLWPLSWVVSRLVIDDVGPYAEGDQRVRQWKYAGEVKFGN